MAEQSRVKPIPSNCVEEGAEAADEVPKALTESPQTIATSAASCELDNTLPSQIQENKATNKTTDE